MGIGQYELTEVQLRRNELLLPGRVVFPKPSFCDHYETLPSQGYDMNQLPFGWQEQESLIEELVRPIAKLSLEFAPDGKPVYVTLWRFDGTGLLVHSYMYGVAEHIEVGVLQFNRVFAPETQEILLDAPLVFGNNLTAVKLTIEESGTSSESGIILQASTGEELVVVAGARPYSIAIRGVELPNSTFEPEYDLDCYQRTAIA